MRKEKEEKEIGRDLKKLSSDSEKGRREVFCKGA